MNKLERSSLYQLTLTRFLLILREPEAIFWIFIFPILLAVGLGIAFRNRPADVLQVGATTTQLSGALAGDKGLAVATMNEPDGMHALATGRIVLLAEQSADGVGTGTTIRIRTGGLRGCWWTATSRRRQDATTR